MRKPSLALLGTLCLLSLSPRPVLADADATAVARALTRPAAAPTAAKASKVVAARERRPFREADGRLPLVVRLPAGKPAEAYGLLPIAPGLGAIHLTPEQLKRFRERHPELRPVVAPPRHTLLNASESWTGASAARVANDLDGTGVVVGVIDTGIDAAHPDFRNADGSTRIAWYMQRQSPAGLHPELEERYGCTDPDQSPCAIFSREDIDLALALDPDSAPRDGDGHGTHVTSIAAGNGGIMGAKPKPTYVGVAPGATIISVSPAGGGGFSDPDIINAARFIFDQAEAMGMPAVVNVSLGSDFGPHDGTSALEMGLAALVGAPGRVMTVAAGNSGTLYNLDGQGPFGVHTEVHASPNAVTRVPIQQPGAAGTVDGSGFVWVNFRPGDEVSVGLEGPDGEWIAPVAPGDDRGYDYSFDGFSGNAGVINNVVDDRTQLTRETNGAVVFWEGTWPGETGLFAVTLRGHGDAQLWITGLGGGRQGGGSLGLSFERATK
ncbi:MAG: S8 family serine peptidase, partial [Myxococcales bacterium]|nr:S8 family serine peptidase [Myxococcales bacterium]